MRTIILIDGQNLYHMARRAWSSGQRSSYTWPSYDVEKLAHALAGRTPGRILTETRFYTGVPNPGTNSSQLFWHGFWSNKIRYLRSRGVYVYRGRVNAGGQEKGVDVSLALDLVRATYEQQYEVAIIVSQDLGLRTRSAPCEGDCPSARAKARFRVVLPGWTWQPLTKGSSGHDLGSD